MADDVLSQEPMREIDLPRTNDPRCDVPHSSFLIAKYVVSRPN
jgi:hypothetical protein